VILRIRTWLAHRHLDLGLIEAAKLSWRRKRADRCDSLGVDH
jgi:hypothetical protein